MASRERPPVSISSGGSERTMDMVRWYLLHAAVSDDGLGLDEGGLSSLLLGFLDRLHDGRGVGAVRDDLGVPPVRFVPEAAAAAAATAAGSLTTSSTTLP